MGTHCAESTCHQLDFLPFKCDLCHQTFCSEHRSYKEHSCPEAYRKDKIVPTCPLCRQALPVSRGMDADQRVNKHIEMECQSEKKFKMKSSALCNFASCRVKELVPVICETCHLHFCLNHRFPDQHNCQKAQAKPQTMRSANPFRTILPTTAISTPTPVKAQPLNPRDKSEEDRLLAQAIAASLNEPPVPRAPAPSTGVKSEKERKRKEQEDIDFAIALSLSEAENGKKRKTVSVN